MRLYDNTRLSTYKKCPRKYFFRHALHITPDRGPAAPLAFGAAWHSGQDVVWQLLSEGEPKDEVIVEGAMRAFLETWQEEEMPWPLDIEQEKMLSPRTPGIAAEMYFAYVAKRRPFIEPGGEYELISIEEPFLVPIDPDSDHYGYIGRRDKIIKYRGQYWVVEHKTTTLYDKKHGFRQSYLDTYSPNSQVDGYAHSLHMRYGDDAGGVLVDVALVHKHEHEWFKILPVQRRTSALDAWLSDTRNWISRVERDRERLQSEIEGEEPIMRAFPRNTEACFDFGSMCPYRDICRFHEAPHLFESAPDGFKVEKWNPVKELKLERIDIHDED